MLCTVRTLQRIAYPSIECIDVLYCRSNIFIRVDVVVVRTVRVETETTLCVI